MSASRARSRSAPDRRRMSDSPRFWTSVGVCAVDLRALHHAKYINLVFRRGHVDAGHFSPPPHERIRMGLNRRDVLKLGLFTSAALMLPAERLARAKLAVADRMPTSRLPKPFTVPFATPPVLEPTLRGTATDYYNIVQKQAGVEILPGYTTQIWGYNGITPGPTIKVRRGPRSRSSARPTTCPTSTRRCATTSGRRPTSTGPRRCRSTTATRATSRTPASARTTGTPTPRTGGPSGTTTTASTSRRRTPTWGSPACTSCRTTSSRRRASRRAPTTCRSSSATRSSPARASSSSTTTASRPSWATSSSPTAGRGRSCASSSASTASGC